MRKRAHDGSSVSLPTIFSISKTKFAAERRKEEKSEEILFRKCFWNHMNAGRKEFSASLFFFFFSKNELSKFKC